MNKEFSHATAKGGYSSEQMIPLVLVSDKGLLDELNRRGMRVKYIRQGKAVTPIKDRVKLGLSPSTKVMELVVE